MAGGAAGQKQRMRDFVSRLFQGSPDLSILTHAIIRKKYLDHIGLENLSKLEKEQLKQLVEEELVQMKVDQPSSVEIRTEAQDSFKSGDHKRPLHISHSSEDEIKNEKEQKRQKIEKTLEVSSDEKDSGIDSKKRLCHRSPTPLRMFSDSSDQGDSGSGNHSDESESDEETTRSKSKPLLQGARRERGGGRKSPQGQGIRGLQKRRVSESEETYTGQSDLEEEGKECPKVTKVISLKQRDFKKKVGKGSKDNDPKGNAKNRSMNKHRDKNNLSEEGTDLSEVEEIPEKKREWSESETEEKKSFSANKAQQRRGPGTQKGLKGNENEDGSGNGPVKKFNLQKKRTDSQCRRKSRVIEDLESSSEDSSSQSPVRKEGAKRARGERGSQQIGNHSKPKRQPKERGERKKIQRGNLCRKKPEEVKKMTQRIQESTSEESESESGEHKSSEEEEKWVQDPTSSAGESQTEVYRGQPRKAALIPSSESESDEDQRRSLEKKGKHVSGSDSSQGEKKLKKRGAQSEKHRGQLWKAALISLHSESESEESEDGDPRRTREKESKPVSRCNSSQREKLKKSGAQKPQRKSISREISLLDSEDSGSEFKRKKKIQSQQQRTKKPQRRSATKEKQREESSQEEGSSSEEDEPTTSQKHHHGKDKKHHSGKNEEHPFIQRLKRYIRECGVRRNYKKLLASCHSRKAQIQVLKDELENLGIKGPPSLAKCKALKQKREEAAEMASLDINNIIASEGRPKRCKVWSLYNKPQESSSSPEELTVRRHTTDWSQLRGVISSDGESS